MIQVIGNLLIIELTPEDKARTITEQIMARFEELIGQNALLTDELKTIKENQRKLSLVFPG